MFKRRQANSHFFGLMAVALSAVIFAAQAQAQEKPGARLYFDKIENGEVYFNLWIHLPGGYKTFWRTPFLRDQKPTQFDWSGSSGIDIGSVNVDWPLPTLMYLQDDTPLLGYSIDVIIPMKARMTASKAMIKLDADYALCRRKCHYVEQQMSLKIPASKAYDMSKWRQAVPRKTSAQGWSATLGTMDDGWLEFNVNAGAEKIKGLLIVEWPDGSVDVKENLPPQGQSSFFMPDDGKSRIGGLLTITTGLPQNAIEVQTRVTEE